MDLKGTKTEKNLMAAFAGEAQAHTKYEYYASQAAKDGFQQISAIFSETSHNEREHAKLWFKLLHNGMPDTRANLKDAMAGESYEWTDMYALFAKEAREEGFEDIAKLFEGVGAIEKEHDKRYQMLLDSLEQDLVFKSESCTVWVCRNCGHIHVSENAPEICPVCAHPKAFFERRAENY